MDPNTQSVQLCQIANHTKTCIKCEKQVGKCCAALFYSNCPLCYCQACYDDLMENSKSDNSDNLDNSEAQSVASDMPSTLISDFHEK